MIWYTACRLTDWFSTKFQTSNRVHHITIRLCTKIWFELNWFTKISGSWRLSRKEWMTFCIFHSKEKMRDELVTPSNCDWSVVTVSTLVLVGCDDEIALNKDTGIKPMSNVLFYWVSWAVHSRDHQTLTHTTLQHASSQVPSHKLTLLWNWKTRQTNA